jgi:hypothetical protein
VLIGVSTYMYECLRLYCYLQKRRVILYVCIMAKVGTFLEIRWLIFVMIIRIY